MRPVSKMVTNTSARMLLLTCLILLPLEVILLSSEPKEENVSSEPQQENKDLFKTLRDQFMADDGGKEEEIESMIMIQKSGHPEQESLLHTALCTYITVLLIFL
ncbi:uncharacterized protein O3C94_017884 [Discoglossus pictus]